MQCYRAGHGAEAPKCWDGKVRGGGGGGRGGGGKRGGDLHPHDKLGISERQLLLYPTISKGSVGDPNQDVGQSSGC